MTERDMEILEHHPNCRCTLQLVQRGDKVRILDRCTKYGGRFNGRTGTVEIAYPGSSTVAVSIPGEFNRASSSGLYWFTLHNLEKIEEEDKEETPMLKGYTAATVKFLSGSNTNTAYFYACYDQSIRPGDIVVLATAHHGLGLGKVDSIGGMPHYVTEHREIVARVDMTPYTERQERAAEMAKVAAEMDAMVKDFQAEAVYEMVAEKNPAMRTLLDKFRALSAPAPTNDAGRE